MRKILALSLFCLALAGCSSFAASHTPTDGWRFFAIFGQDGESEVEFAEAVAKDTFPDG